MGWVTFDGVCLCELCEVHDQVLGEGVPCLAVVHAQIDMGT